MALQKADFSIGRGEGTESPDMSKLTVMSLANGY